MNVTVITPMTDECVEIDSDYVTIFLAGGCTTKWRDELIAEISNHTALMDKKIIIYSPYCDTTKIKFETLLRWERDHLIKADLIVYNFEGSDSVQPGSMFELGRYVYPKGNAIVNVSPDYKLYREVTLHVKLMNEQMGYTYMREYGHRYVPVVSCDITNLAEIILNWIGNHSCE